MPIENKEYVCEKCHRPFTTYDEALECEHSHRANYTIVGYDWSHSLDKCPTVLIMDQDTKAIMEFVFNKTVTY